MTEFGRGTLAYNDGDADTGTVSFRHDAIDDVNRQAIRDKVTNLHDAIDAVTRGINIGLTYGNYEKFYSTGFPSSDPDAHAQLKWYVSMEDTVLKNRFGMELPCADGRETMPNSDFMDITSGNGSDLKAAIEDIHLSPANNPVLVLSVKIVGRNTHRK